MSEDRYNGWTNRETWAVALYINNDQGWLESVLDSLREAMQEVVVGEHGYLEETTTLKPWEAGHIIQDNVENALEEWRDYADEAVWAIARDIGSLWRVNWGELGEAFLEELGETSPVGNTREDGDPLAD